MMKEVKNNILIARFMGWYHVGYADCWNHDEDNRSLIDKDFKYHQSWDWLMPVVEKIEDLLFKNDVFMNVHILGGCQVNIISSEMKEIVNFSGQSKLLSTYGAVVEFIKWYNNTKQNGKTT